MNAFDFIHANIKKKLGLENYFRPSPDISLIKDQLNKGLVTPVEAEKKISRYYTKLKLKTTKFGDR
mgnify:CR=1 FL=1